MDGKIFAIGQFIHCTKKQPWLSVELFFLETVEKNESVQRKIERLHRFYELACWSACSFAGRFLRAIFAFS